jgi:hypothetical protein
MRIGEPSIGTAIAFTELNWPVARAFWQVAAGEVIPEQQCAKSALKPSYHRYAIGSLVESRISPFYLESCAARQSLAVNDGGLNVG